jgi:hypothetical protein
MDRLTGQDGVVDLQVYPKSTFVEHEILTCELVVQIQWESARRAACPRWQTNVAHYHTAERALNGPFGKS